MYNYKLGEGLVLRGDVLHQTVPFEDLVWPEEIPCRVLLCVVLAAPELMRSDQDRSVLARQLMLTPSAGCELSFLP